MNQQRTFAGYKPQHFRWQSEGKVGIVTLDRPEKKNPLTFDSYAELRDLFRGLQYASDIKTVVMAGAGGNFSSGGDVHEIIGPLTKMTMPELLDFTRMTGDLVKAMRSCPQPIVAAIDGVCAGAGAMVALASDFRYGTAQSKTAYLFVRVGLAGCDMGACTLLPRLVGQGRAAELLYTGRSTAGRRRPRLGILQQALRAREAARRSQSAGSVARRRPDLRARHDQEAPPPGMEHGARRGDRSRGPGAGDLHADEGFPPRVRGVRREEPAQVRRRLTARAVS